MTLLVDPALLYASGYGLGRWSKNGRAGTAAGTIVVGAVLGLSVATYSDAPYMRPVWEHLGGRSGRDLILNSWVLNFDPAERSARRRILVGFLFGSYPAWMAAGLCAGRRRRARRE